MNAILHRLLHSLVFELESDSLPSVELTLPDLDCFSSLESLEYWPLSWLLLLLADLDDRCVVSLAMKVREQTVVKA